MTVTYLVILDFNKFFPSVEETLSEEPLSFARTHIVTPSDKKSRIHQTPKFFISQYWRISDHRKTGLLYV